MSEYVSVIEAASGLFYNKAFIATDGHPQGFDFERHHKYTKCRSYEIWAWKRAYQRIRLERAVNDRKAIYIGSQIVHMADPINRPHW